MVALMFSTPNVLAEQFYPFGGAFRLSFPAHTRRKENFSAVSREPWRTMPVSATLI